MMLGVDNHDAFAMNLSGCEEEAPDFTSARQDRHQLFITSPENL